VEVHLLAVGKLRPYYRVACDEYLGRLSRFGPVVEREVRESGRAGSVLVQRREETARVVAALPARATTVVLDGSGSPWSSTELARRLDRWRIAASPIALVIGGAHGLEPAFGEGAAFRWSLGPLTLPHQLARVIVLEQWYRAWTILRGEPYHKGG
jgi:23S rRNA (pseudouridine1915-N3)-methyltransferase